ncbi:hypothetical protein L195_g035941, partial [Trifolium pratense]
MDVSLLATLSASNKLILQSSICLNVKMVMALRIQISGRRRQEISEAAAAHESEEKVSAIPFTGGFFVVISVGAARTRRGFVASNPPFYYCERRCFYWMDGRPLRKEQFFNLFYAVSGVNNDESLLVLVWNGISCRAYQS